MGTGDIGVECSNIFCGEGLGVAPLWALNTGSTDSSSSPKTEGKKLGVPKFLLGWVSVCWRGVRVAMGAQFRLGVSGFGLVVWGVCASGGQWP